MKKVLIATLLGFSCVAHAETAVKFQNPMNVSSMTQADAEKAASATKNAPEVNVSNLIKYPNPMDVNEMVSKEGDPCTRNQLQEIHALEGVQIRILAAADTNLRCSATKCLPGYDKTNVNGANRCEKTNKNVKDITDIKTLMTKAGDPCSDIQLRDINATKGVLVQVYLPQADLKCSATECKDGYKRHGVEGVYQCWRDNATTKKPQNDAESCTDDQLKALHATAGKIQESGVCWPTECEGNRALADIDSEHDNPECVLESEVCGPGEKLIVDEYGSTARKCEKAGQQTAKFVGDLERRLAAASDKVEAMTQDLKTKKWRNKDGKFNTARLASDGIAGIVLGTTAGLITAHVVKKGQIKNGYEDIKCTIAGQEVSDWGDELTVGVR